MRRITFRNTNAHKKMNNNWLIVELSVAPLLLIRQSSWTALSSSFNWFQESLLNDYRRFQEDFIHIIFQLFFNWMRIQWIKMVFPTSILWLWAICLYALANMCVRWVTIIWIISSSYWLSFTIVYKFKYDHWWLITIEYYSLSHWGISIICH